MTLANKENQAKTPVPAPLPRLVATIPVTGTIGDIKVNAATNRVFYVRSELGYGSLNGSTNRVTASRKAGESPTYLAVNARTNRVYVTNMRSGTVSVISGTSSRIVRTIQVGQRPFGIAVNTRTNRVYAALLSGSIVVINGSTQRLEKTFTVGGSPAAVAINERTNRIYVTNVANNTVTVIDGNTQTIIATVKVGRNPIITPFVNYRTNRIYVANNLSRFLSVIDGRTHETKSIALGRFQIDIAGSSETNRIYVASAQQEGPGAVFVVNGMTGAVAAALPAPTFSGMLINSRTQHLFIGDTESNRLDVYNGRTNRRILTLETEKPPFNMAVNELTNRIYAGNDNAITVVQDEN